MITYQQIEIDSLSVEVKDAYKDIGGLQVTVDNQLFTIEQQEESINILSRQIEISHDISDDYHESIMSIEEKSTKAEETLREDKNIDFLDQVIPISVINTINQLSRYQDLNTD